MYADRQLGSVLQTLYAFIGSDCGSVVRESLYGSGPMRLRSTGRNIVP